MSTSEEYLAKLGIDTSDVDKAVDSLTTILGHLGNQFEELAGPGEKAENIIRRVATSSTEAAEGVRSAATATGEGSEAWKQYVKDLQEAEKAFREFKQGQVTGEGGGSDLGDLGDLDKLMRTYEAQNASLIGAIKDRNSQIISDEQRRADETARINDVAARQWISAEQARADQARRINDVSAQQWIANEQKKIDAAKARENAIGGRDYANTSVLVDSGIKDREETSKAFARALRDQMQAQQANTEAQAKAAGVSDKLAESTGRVTTSAISTRYALYDMSNSLGLVSGSILGVITGATAFSIAFESQFAEVRRTVGVTGDAADDMKAKFVKLSTEIPRSFGELTQIGGLAGQLDIIDSRVVSFTKTVAQFSASSDMSVDATATSLGRLDSLLNDVDGRYANLASSILNVGINSVATESQIASIASQIAASASQANLMASEVVGLSGSLASLGVAPEAARGTILRVFSQLNSAVSLGGERLNTFAAISGMTADEFKNSWGTEGGFTKTFLGFLQGLQNDGAGAEVAMRSLGIAASRDLNAMLKMSQNVEDVARNLKLAEIGFNDASVLTRNFGVISETTGAKVQMLGNSAAAFAASIGDATTGPLGMAVDSLNRYLQTITAINNTPLGQWTSFVTTAIFGLVAVLGLLTAGGARTVASVLAIRTALGGVALESAVASGGIRGFGATLLGAAGAAKVFQAALAATGIGLAAMVGFWAIAEGVTALTNALKSGKDQAEDYFGTLDGLADAIAADNVELFTANVKTQSDAFNGAVDSAGTWGEALVGAATAANKTGDGVEETTKKITGSTIAIEENTKAALRNILVESEKFQALMKNQDLLDRLQGGKARVPFTDDTIDVPKFDMSKYLDTLTSQGAEAAKKFMDAYKEGLKNQVADNDVIPVEFKQGIIDSVTKDLAPVQEAGKQVGNAIQAGIEEATAARNTEGFLGKDVAKDQQNAEEYSAILGGLINDIYGVGNAEAELSNIMGQLGQDFVNNGAAAAFTGDNLQAAIKSIYDSSAGAPEAAARMQGLFDALVSGGYASAQQLAGLQSIIASLAGGKAVEPIKVDLSGFTSGVAKARKALSGGGGGGGKKKGGGLNGEVRTLIDYANDLRKVTSRAFEIRFSAGQGRDQITGTWNDIRQATVDANKAIKEAIEDSNRALREHRAEVGALNADRGLATYWLTVAEAYGDTLRAAELRADILTIDDKLKKSSETLTSSQKKNQEAVTEAQKKTNKTLVGNSAEAIANRAEILGLVGSYQDYITELAASGMSQGDLKKKSAELKGEFEKQATQLGYNKDELGKYSKGFDDVTLAIGRVPRNITVSTNVNPAIQALNELNAKLRKETGQTYTNTVKTAYNDAGAKKAARAQTIIGQMAELQASIARLNSGSYSAADAASGTRYSLMGLKDLQGKLSSGNYWSGGFTGRGGKYEWAGNVHRGEVVVASENVNQASGTPKVSWLQSQMAAAAGRPAIQPRQMASAAASTGPTLVAFSPEDRALLMRIEAASAISVSGTALQQVVNSGNLNSNRRREG